MLQDSCEILKGKLYFLSSSKTYYPTSDIVIINIDNEFLYEGYYRDFGPLSISCIYKYCQKMNKKLKLYTSTAKKIVHLTTINAKKKVNSAFLMGCFLISYMRFTPQEAYKALSQTDIRYIAFRDASNGRSSFPLSLSTCLKGFHKAIVTKILKIRLFNINEYDHYNTISNGDIHWIIPKKILAFTGPTSSTRKIYGCVNHSPGLYLSIFHKWRVSAVIRLNSAEYDKSSFTNSGIGHYDLVFADGGVPSEKLVLKFLKIVEESGGAVAVHCKAGLGRTGTLIGCYLMKHFHFNAGEAIAWIRVCRPGSVIGCQQNWLIERQSWCWKLGNYVPSDIKRTFSNRGGDFTSKTISSKQRDSLRLSEPKIREPDSYNLPQDELLKRVKLVNSINSSTMDKTEFIQNTGSIPDILYDFEYFPSFRRKNLYQFRNKQRPLIRALDDSATDDLYNNEWLDKQENDEEVVYKRKEIVPKLVNHKNSNTILSNSVPSGEPSKL